MKYKALSLSLLMHILFIKYHQVLNTILNHSDNHSKYHFGYHSKYNSEQNSKYKILNRQF